MSRRDKIRGKLYIISGPSGAGKGTICERLVNERKIDLSISMTTREPREGEKDGESYYFVSKEEFEQNIEEGKMLEYANVFDNIYGTPKEPIEKKLERGRDVILEIDVQGGLQVREKMPGDTVMIFILPPSIAELRGRLVGRGKDSDEVIKKRLKGAIDEIRFIGEYDYYIVNDDLDRAIKDALSIIDAERLKVPDKVMPIIRKYEEE